MKLKELVRADICRDGGSYEANFTTDDGVNYGLLLERSRMPDGEGLHHRWLIEYRGITTPARSPVEQGAPVTRRNFLSRRFGGCVPVVTGSAEEEALIRRLDEFLDSKANSSSSTSNEMNRLREMRQYIVRREPCSPADLREAGFTP